MKKISIIGVGILLVIGLTISSINLYYFKQEKSLGATILFPSGGGTGTSTNPQLGDVLVGDGTGKYKVVATSTLGFGGSGTVTSVDMTVPTGLSISGNPITTSGTLALSLQTGYNIPLTASTTDWNNKISSQWTTIDATNISFSGTTTQSNVKANSSAGLNILNTSGQIVASFGPGGGQAASFQNGGSFANYLRVGGSSHADSMFESKASTNDGSTGIIHGYNASSTEVFALNSDGDIDIGTWKGTAIADTYISSASNWNTAYNNRVDSWTAPLGFSSNTASITQSGSTTNGYLTSTDWNTFNQKADASSVSGNATLYHWNGASDIAGYEMFRTAPDNAAEVIESTTTVANTKLLIDSYISSTTASVGRLTFVDIPSGTWNFHTWATVSNTSGSNFIVYDIYKRSATSGAETLLFSATSSALSTTLAEMNWAYTYSTTTIASSDGSDRLVAKVYAYSTISGKTISFYYSNGSHASHVGTPITLTDRGYVRYFDNATISGNWTFSGPTTTISNLSVTTSRLGTIVSGIWNGSTIGVGYGGTGLSSITQGYALIGGLGNTMQATSSLYINSNGYVGIGSTTPSEKLTVAGGNIYQGYSATTNVGMTEIASVSTAVNVNAIYVDNNFLYYGTVANASSTEFEIYEATNKNAYNRIGGYEVGVQITDIDKIDNIAVLAAGSSDYYLIDISNKASTSLISNISLPGNAQRVKLRGKYLYTCSSAATGNEFNIIDISLPSSPVVIGGYDMSGLGCFAMEEDNNTIFITTNTATSGQELIILDIENPSSPTKIGGIKLSNEANARDSLYVNNDVLYIGLIASSTASELFLYNIRDKANPVLLSSIEVGASVNSIKGFKDNIIIGTANRTGDEIISYNVSSSTNPVLAFGNEVGTGVLSVGYNSGKIFIGSSAGIRSFEMIGIKANTVETGSITTGKLIVQNDALFNKNTTFDKGITIGREGIMSYGGIVVGNASTTYATSSVTGVFNGRVSIGTSTPSTNLLTVGYTYGSQLLVGYNGVISATNFSGTSTGSNTGNETTSTIGILINGSTATTAPADTDRFAFSASSLLRYITWANIKATLKTYFDTLYGAITGQVWTGMHDFGGATLEIPNGASNSFTATGQVFVDTTSDHLMYEGTATRTLTYIQSPTVTIASTTLYGGSGTSTIPLGFAIEAETWNSVWCGSSGGTGVGTTTLRFGDGTNYTNTITATSTAYSNALSSNNTFTAGEVRQIQVISTAGSPNYITCTINKTVTAD